MQRLLFLFLIAAAAGLALGPFWSPAEADPDEGARGTYLRVGRGDLEVRLEVIGELQPNRSTTIASSLSGDRGKIAYLVDDGALVEAGEVLVRLDRTPFDEAYLQAELEAGLAEGQVEARRHAAAWQASQSERSVKNAGYELELAALERHRFDQGEGPLELARLRADEAVQVANWKDQQILASELAELLSDGHIQPAEVEQLNARAAEAGRSADLAKQQANTYETYILPTRTAALKLAVERAKAEIAETEISSAAKLAEARSAVTLAERDLAAARARLEAAAKDLERCELRAPAAGMVVLTEEFRDGERRKPRIGDSVWQGQRIAYLPDLDSMEVLAKIREVDVHKVLAGARATVRVDAYPGLALDAQVRALGVLAERETGGSDKTFRLMVTLDASDPRLRPGMTARAMIHSGSARDALLLPLQALWEEADAAWCWAVEPGGELRRVDLVLGLRSQQAVEVLEGLEAGALVSLVPPAGE